MKKPILISIFVLIAASAVGQTVSPVKTIRAETIITETDLQLISGSYTNAFSDMLNVIGQEARTTLYAGRPIFFNDVGPPALVARNQIVSIEFKSGGLTIVAEARSLERGGVGDRVRVMNLSSRSTLFGQVQEDGTIKVMK